jgi:hypothetical protein
LQETIGWFLPNKYFARLQKKNKTSILLRIMISKMLRITETGNGIGVWTPKKTTGKNREESEGFTQKCAMKEPLFGIGKDHRTAVSEAALFFFCINGCPVLNLKQRWSATFQSQSFHSTLKLPEGTGQTNSSA